MNFQKKILHYECVENRAVVYLDESGFALDSPRTNGYSLKGERCYASKDWHASGRVNVIGAITNFKLFNVCMFDCYINSDVFHSWVTQELLPNTPRHSVIVLDNATFHKRNDTLEAIEKAGHTIEFLPPYSWSERQKRPIHQFTDFGFRANARILPTFPTTRVAF